MRQRSLIAEAIERGLRRREDLRRAGEPAHDTWTPASWAAHLTATIPGYERWLAVSTERELHQRIATGQIRIGGSRTWYRSEERRVGKECRARWWAGQ